MFGLSKNWCWKDDFTFRGLVIGVFPTVIRAVFVANILPGCFLTVAVAGRLPDHRGRNGGWQGHFSGTTVAIFTGKWICDGLNFFGGCVHRWRWLRSAELPSVPHLRMDYGIRQLENAILFSFSSPHYILPGEINSRSARINQFQPHQKRAKPPQPHPFTHFSVSIRPLILRPNKTTILRPNLIPYWD